MTGGPTIQDECRSYIASNCNLLPGQVYVSTAGSLPCRSVIHAYGPRWQGGRRGEENILYDAVDTCLTKTAEQGSSSVAFPGIGAGDFKVPVGIATGAIVDAVKAFCSSSRGKGKVREVYLIDTKEHIVKSFLDSISRCGLGDSIETVDGKKPTGKTYNNIVILCPVVLIVGVHRI